MKTEETFARPFVPVILGLILCSAGCVAEAPSGEDDAVAEVEALLGEPCDDGSDGECLELADDALLLAMTTPGIRGIEIVEAGVVDVLLDGDSIRERLHVGARVFRPRMGALRRPLVSRVTAAEPIEGGLRLTMEATTMNDVFRRGRIRRRYAVNLARARANDPDSVRRMDGATPPPSDVGASSEAMRDAEQDPTRCDPDTLDPIYERGGVRFGIDRCEFGFDTVIDYDIEWGFGRPDRAYISVTGSFEAALHAYFELEAEYERAQEWPVGRPVEIAVSPLGLNVTLSLVAGYELTSAASLSAEAGFELDASVSARLDWERGEGVEMTVSRSAGFDPIGPTARAEGSLEARVYLEPRIGIEAVQLLDGWLGLQLYSELDMDLDARVRGASNEENVAELCYDLRVGLVPELGARVGFDFAEPWWEGEHIVDSARYETSLANDCALIRETDSGVCTEGVDECVVGSDCTGLIGDGPRAACFSAGCSDDCTCTVMEIENCCIADSECRGMGPDSSCQNNRCVRADQAFEEVAPGSVISLCSEPSDCDDGVDATRDLCERGHCAHERRPSAQEDSLGAWYECARDRDCGSDSPDMRARCVSGQCQSIDTVRDTCEWLDCDDEDASTADSCVDGACRHLQILSGS
ncbi:MAG: hypothetical protein AB8I08_12360 [Sandaracinaceae bacterium]